jgi:predicted amidohydrolase
MQDKLKVALVQTSLIWESPKENRAVLSEKIRGIKSDVDVIVLPEMFTSGFTMHPDAVAETMDGTTINWMKALAKDVDAAICASLVIREGANYYNRYVFVKPDASIVYYDKRHTFTLAGEDKVYKSGNENVLITYKGWKIRPLICYDLRFPVWARNIDNYDMLIYVANWPKPRVNAWDALLKARAIENMSYCIGVNRVGVDANDLEYSGHSNVYNGLGDAQIQLSNTQEGIAVTVLDKNHLTTIRENLRFLNDRDSFIIN